MLPEKIARSETRPSPSIEEFETFCPGQLRVTQMRFYLTRPLILQYICSNHYY